MFRFPLMTPQDTPVFFQGRTEEMERERERELAPASAAPRSSSPTPHAFQAECLHFAAGRVRDSVSLVPGVGEKRSCRPCLLILVKGHPSNTVLLLGLDFLCLVSNLYFPGICIFLGLCSARGLNCVYQTLLIVHNQGFQRSMFIHVYSLLIFTLSPCFFPMLSSSLPVPLTLSCLFLVCFGDPVISSGCIQEPRQGLTCRSMGALSEAALYQRLCF